MCGVVSIVYGEPNDELGREAAFLLKKLEYRGYDSTGGAFFGADGSVLLKKKVGGPTKVIEELEIERDGGLKFIGQVRWATYGSVTDTNAQPHEMSCRCHIVGAHNGNISNTDTLKEFLVENGHRVLSDNDGEMLTHVIEHFYDEISHLQHPAGDEERIRTMVRAIRQTHRKVDGSYAACVALPDLPGVFAIKAGSSLYAGKGSDANGPFIVVSSDLTSVLSKTRFLIPLAEGEGIYFTENEYFVFSMETDRIHQPKLTRSRLNVADITLQGRYKYFMQQEIYTASENIDRLLKYYFMEEDEKALFEVFERHFDRCQGIVFEVLKFYDIFDQAALRKALAALFASEDYRTVFDAAREYNGQTKPPVSAPVFTSDEAALLSEILGMEDMPYPRLRLIDQIIIWKKKRLIVRYRDELTRIIRETAHRGGRTFLVGAGTSYHAALIGGYFFNNIARVSVIPANPGLFRSLYINGLTDHDTIIGITQSGETKDLLDIFNDVRRAHGEKIHLVSIVNNEISTIPQEKSDFFLPILCGPEIAVAATKSFISQIALFYLLAQMTVLDPGDVRAQVAKVRSVLDFTLKDIEEDVAEVALRLFLKPSIHILGTSLMGLAREGALKIREVVLNHTEGYDSAEFKHGPNTILGKNTIYSLEDMENLVVDAFEFFGELLEMRSTTRAPIPKSSRA